MNKNAGPEISNDELGNLPKALKAARLSSQDQAVILARIVEGISCESWQEAARNFSLTQWHVLPVSANTAMNIDDELVSDSESVPLSPFREVAGVLTKAMFANLLARELLRISRNGGSLSLVTVSICEKKRLVTAIGQTAVRSLERLLASILLHDLDICDGLGLLRKGQYVCSLPGMGQLAARHFAEKIQASFEEAAKPFFPGGGINAGNGVYCALGIVNVLQGESKNVEDLLKRAKTSLEIALNKAESHIHQETASMPLENTTLVQSSEKRFLFFGGDPS